MQQTIEQLNTQLAALGAALCDGRLGQTEYRARRGELLRALSREHGQQDATLSFGAAIGPHDRGARWAPSLLSRLNPERWDEASGVWLLKQAALPVAFVALLVILLVLWVG